MRRSHHKVDVPNVVICPCGKPTLPHGVCPSCGNYKGRSYVAPAEE